MKTPYRIAQELGVSPQAVYKKLTADFLKQYAEGIEVVQYKTKGGSKPKYRLDLAAERALKNSFNSVQQLVDEKVEYSLLNQLNSEIAYLRQKLDEMTALLHGEQAAHSETRRLLSAPAAPTSAPCGEPPTTLMAWLKWRGKARKGWESWTR